MSESAYETPPELAPSDLTDDVGTWPRTIGLTGLMAISVGGLILVLNAAGSSTTKYFTDTSGVVAVIIGLVLMLFHASREDDSLIRRMYGMVGGFGLPLVGVVFSLMPIMITYYRAVPEGETRVIQSLFFPYGWMCFVAGLFFLIIFCKIETETTIRSVGLRLLLTGGVIMSVAGIVLGFMHRTELLPYSVVLTFLGLLYLCGHISQNGGADEGGYRAAIGMGAVGLFTTVLAIGLSVTMYSKFFVPHGVLLMTSGLIYLFVSLCLVSDWQWVVLTRRELGAYFYSPIAYLVLLMNILVGFFNYHMFTEVLASGPMLEPILRNFLLGTIYAIFVVVFIVPALTMRLISEEKRTGTYEVLMCAPVSELTVLMSKLISSVIFYMLTWSVWGIYIIALRTETATAFEYRPLFTFGLALLISGFVFLSMGLFFSCLTKNQIVAAGLTFFGMLAHVALFYAGRGAKPDSVASILYNNLSFVNLWFESLDGRVQLREMFLQFSQTIFWFYLSIKVLEARRWG